MIRWREPLWLFALLIPAGLLLWDLFLRKSRLMRRKQFASLSLWETIAPDRSDSMRRLKRWLFIISLLFLAIGLANPQVGTRYEEVTRQGIDIFIVVDVSKSMDTEDIRPSRLIKARYELSRFLQGLKGDRVGIIPFAGTAYSLMPLTLDYSAAAMFLDILETDLIPNPGTNLEAAIGTALDAFPYEEGRGQAIILVSDGEDHEGGALKAAQKAAEKNVTIYTLGMALSKGDPIPLTDEEGNQIGWKNDDEGKVITSKLNEDLLRQIANATGGSYFRATQGGEEFRKVYKHMFGMDRKELEARRITDYEDRFQPFLIIALILLLLEFILPAGKTKLMLDNKFRSHS
ncbi:VWA domain-containing protein [bacterium]|nr:VWA domain-containing protein [bacterium]